jgi:hypothetical protein
MEHKTQNDGDSSMYFAAKFEGNYTELTLIYSLSFALLCVLCGACPASLCRIASISYLCQLTTRPPTAVHHRHPRPLINQSVQSDLQFADKHTIAGRKAYLYTDGSGDGTAWYDPQSGEGCLIMNHAANIVEDAQNQLWMVTNGYLYRHSLNSP